jgi:TolB-like protein
MHRLLRILLVLAGAAASVVPVAARQTADVVAVVAVVPFTNVSGDATVDWLSIGIAESVLADLSGQFGVAVFGVEVLAQAIRRAGLDASSVDEARILAICRELGVTHFVTGGYQRVGDQIRITARLVEVETGTLARTFKVDGSLDDIFGLEDQIVAGLGWGAPAPVAAGSVPAVPPSPTDDPPFVPSTVAPNAAAGGVLGTGLVLPANVPEAPVAPDVISRNEAGQATLRAVRLMEPLDLDGALDERVYQIVPAITGLVQIEPIAGVPATERTEFWVLFDDANIYVSVRVWDSAPESEWVVNEMRRDSFTVMQNENIGFAFDTFYDRRNNILFLVNPIGGRMDGQVTNERAYNGDWNPIWVLKTGRFEGGWSFEAEIPFKSVRYRPGREQVWGFQLRRVTRWKNEMAYLTRMDQGIGMRGLFQSSAAATLVGLEAPQLRSPIEIKPYLIGDVSSNLNAAPSVLNEPGGNFGIDLIKYGITQNLTADFTINTDFAQVEADEQQVNLTRFSLFFPEKREFFLENQGFFAFGTGGGGIGGGNSDAPILFHSRRIGLSHGQEVPILAGGRLTGRAGKFTLGMVNIQTNDEPSAEALSTNFTAARIKRNVLRRSSIGAIFTNRSISTTSPGGSSQSFGLDAGFAFYDNLSVNAYWAKTEAPGVSGRDSSYSGEFRYAGDRFGVTAEHLFIDERFSPEVGFVRRDDLRKSAGSLRFSPRPRSIDAVRKFTGEGLYDYFTDASGVVETREARGRFGIEFENSDQFDTSYTQTYDFLKKPFEISDGIVIPVGGYDFYNTQVSYSFGGQRRVAGRVAGEHGTFYNGTKTTLAVGGGRGGFGGGRVELSSQFSLEPGVSLNWVDLPQGSFMSTLVTARSTYTISPLMFVSALIQYNSSNEALSTNIRLRWEYRPGSELFIVYNEQRDTLAPGDYPALENRAFIVKVNRLFRF